MGQDDKIEDTSDNENTIYSKEILHRQKLIDTDPISYISDFIIQVSKNITKGKGISQRGVNALFLSTLTGALLFKHTEFPQNILGFLRLYTVPLFFLLYFVVDLSKNIPIVNNYFMKLFKRSDFVYYSIMNDSISLYNLEYYLKDLPFSSGQLTDIIGHLLKSDQFSPKVQASLMYNNALYEIESSNYMKNLLLSFDFKPHAVCVFLKKMAKRLDHDYLDKIIGKYGTFPSVQFCIGYFHQYKKNDPNSYFRSGYDFEYRKITYLDFLVIILVSLSDFIVISLVILRLLMGPKTPEIIASIIGSITSEFIGTRVSGLFPDGFLLFLLFFFCVIVTLLIFDYIYTSITEGSISAYLKRKITEENIREDIIDNVKDIFV